MIELPPTGIQIPTRRIRFIHVEDLEIKIRPAVLDLNPIFRATALVYLRPLSLSTMLPEGHPRRLSDAQANVALAKVFGLSVILGSPTHPEHDAYSCEEWAAWLVAHEWEFEELSSVARVGTNFDPDYQAPPEIEAELPAIDQAHIHLAEPL